jgi:hypothetical protein
MTFDAIVATDLTATAHPRDPTRHSDPEWDFMTWLPLDQPQERFSFAAWFRLSRWSTYDIMLALVALLLAGSVFAPWFQADVRVNGVNGETLNGILVSPKPTETGLAAHGFLWALVWLAVVQLALLAAHYVPGRFALSPPGFHRFLIAISALSLPITLVACSLKPDSWRHVGPFPPNFHLTVGWAYGAGLALGSGVVAVIMAYLESRADASR